MNRLVRILTLLLAPLALASCVVTPGKFVSTLRIDANRDFTFAYLGEVIAIDMGEQFASGMMEGMKSDGDKDGATDTGVREVAQDDDADAARRKAAAREASERKRRAVAETLAKEAGYRRVDYLGDGKYMVDFEISGRLTHGFVYPFNIDAEIVFPFIALELRGKDVVRMKAPAFGRQSSGPVPNPTAESAAKQIDGSFTLDTDAVLVSQNNEDGATPANGRNRIVWKVTPLSQDAPSAVLRVAPLP